MASCLLPCYSTQHLSSSHHCQPSDSGARSARSRLPGSTFHHLCSPYYLSQLPHTDSVSLSAFAFMYFFQIFVDYFISFRYDAYLLTVFYNTVSNGDSFFTLNRHLQLPKQMSLTRPGESYAKLRTWFRGMLNPSPLPSFAHSKLPVTNVSPRLRTRLVLRCVLYEGAFACLHSIMSKLTFGGIFLETPNKIFVFCRLS